MPRQDDDPERTGRAIATFLGEPGGGGSRPPRRRQRGAQAAVGDVRVTELVLSLGASAPPRVVRATAAALRTGLRGSDQLVEEADGGLRIILATDLAGADAWLDRAHSLVRPWLEAMGPGLALIVESPPRPIREKAAPAAS